MVQPHDDDGGPREVIPENAVKLILDGLHDEPQAVAQFAEGLGKHMHYLSIDPTPPVVDAALKYLRGWLLSVLVASDPDWRAQVQESEERIAKGPGPGVSSEELRSILGR